VGSTVGWYSGYSWWMGGARNGAQGYGVSCHQLYQVQRQPGLSSVIMLTYQGPAVRTIHIYALHLIPPKNKTDFNLLHEKKTWFPPKAISHLMSAQWERCSSRL